VVIIDRGQLIADSTLTELLGGRTRVVELHCANPAAMATALRDRGATVGVDGDLLVIEGSSARDVGELAASVGAGPVYGLSERASTFESAYLELAGTLGRPSDASTAESSTP
jgi:hypothetical protein